MRTTLTLDDQLLQQAHLLTGIESRPSLIHEALKTLVQREKARRLAALGATEPELQPIPRRRPE